MGMCLGLEASTHLVLGDVDGCCQVSSLARVGIGVIHLDPVDVVLGAQALCRGCTRGGGGGHRLAYAGRRARARRHPPCVPTGQ